MNISTDYFMGASQPTLQVATRSPRLIGRSDLAVMARG